MLVQLANRALGQVSGICDICICAFSPPHLMFQP
jgi:hypothetical protein